MASGSVLSLFCCNNRLGFSQFMPEAFAEIGSAFLSGDFLQNFQFYSHKGHSAKIKMASLRPPYSTLYGRSDIIQCPECNYWLFMESVESSYVTKHFHLA